MKKPTKVQAPDGCHSHLTAGKVYDVAGFWDIWNSVNGHAFFVITDSNCKLKCLERNCAHLNGKNWIIIETENDSN